MSSKRFYALGGKNESLFKLHICTYLFVQWLNNHCVEGRNFFTRRIYHIAKQKIHKRNEKKHH